MIGVVELLVKVVVTTVTKTAVVVVVVGTSITPNEWETVQVLRAPTSHLGPNTGLMWILSHNLLKCTVLWCATIFFCTFTVSITLMSVH